MATVSSTITLIGPTFQVKHNGKAKDRDKDPGKHESGEQNNHGKDRFLGRMSIAASRPAAKFRLARRQATLGLLTFGMFASCSDRFRNSSP